MSIMGFADAQERMTGIREAGERETKKGEERTKRKRTTRMSGPKM